MTDGLEHAYDFGNIKIHKQKISEDRNKRKNLKMNCKGNKIYNTVIEITLFLLLQIH